MIFSGVVCVRGCFWLFRNTCKQHKFLQRWFLVVRHCSWRVGVLIGVLLREGRSCYSTPRPLLTCSFSVLALLSSSLSSAQPFVPSQQESCAYYQPAKL